VLAVACEQAEEVREMPPPGCCRDILRPPERLFHLRGSRAEKDAALKQSGNRQQRLGI
jgi:hypothetical protein